MTRSPTNERIALGTAQFGLSYGVSNTHGQCAFDEVEMILKAARSSGIDTLDTAVSYGNSESNLGAAGVSDWKVVTKLPALAGGETFVERWVVETVMGSLKRLNIPKVHGLLLHRPQDLIGPCGVELKRALMRVKTDRLVRHVGLSVYDPEELRTLDGSFVPDIVQIPFNVLDRRLIKDGLLHELKSKGVEVHVRSIFLQGLLLMERKSRPSYFDRWNVIWKKWEEWTSENALDPLNACIGFALAHEGIDRVVVGVETLNQLDQILQASNSGPFQWPGELQSLDPELINPSRWKLV